MEDLIAAIADVRDNLRRGRYQNESQVSKMVVMRLLRELGWAVDDPRRVSPEFKIGNRWVDYALLHDPFGAVVLIEVKDVGKASPSGEEQLFGYCVHEGVPLAVLTDGRTWRFYWPAGSGNYEQRRFAVVDLVDGQASECARRLGRYLEFDTVISGRFEDHAQSDYATHRGRIVARQQFGPVAHSLITGADERLVALFCGEVERRCRIRPDEADVRSFLRGWFAQGSDRATRPEEPAHPAQAVLTPAQKAWQTRRARQAAAPGNPAPAASSGSVSFVFLGERRTFTNNDELITALFAEFANRDTTFCEKLAPRVNVRTPILSRSRDDFPRRSRKRARDLPGGWWMNVVGDARAHDGRIRKACEVAGIEYGRDLTVSLQGKWARSV